MNSRWTHLLCDMCWFQLYPQKRPVRIKVTTIIGEGKCCSCAKPTRSGLYYRAEPTKFKCAGKHDPEHKSQVATLTITPE